jgi:hypothetical protein
LENDMQAIMTKCVFAALGLAAGVGVSGYGILGHQDKQDGCPAPVSATAKKMLGDLTGAKIDKETEGGITTYEVAIKGKDGAASVDVAEGGELIAYEHQIAETAVPAAVRAAFAKQHPGAKLLLAEKVEKHSYELAFEVDGKKHAIEILPSGHVPASKGEEDEEDEKAEAQKKEGGEKKGKKGEEKKK